MVLESCTTFLDIDFLCPTFDHRVSRKTRASRWSPACRWTEKKKGTTPHHRHHPPPPKHRTKHVLRKKCRVYTDQPTKHCTIALYIVFSYHLRKKKIFHSVNSV